MSLVFVGAQPNVVLGGEPFHSSGDRPAGAADQSKRKISVGIGELPGDLQIRAHGDIERLGQKRASSVAVGSHKRMFRFCLLYTSPSPRDRQKSRMPSSA